MDNAESYPDAGRPGQKDPAAPQTDRWIRGRDLAKSFQNGGVSIDVLKGVNLDLGIGETVAIVGASGIANQRCFTFSAPLIDRTAGLLSLRAKMSSFLMILSWHNFATGPSGLFFNSITCCLSLAPWKML